MKPFDLDSVLAPEVEVAPETLDPLELHFRKMTEYPLLSHERELDLARRLERADLSITRVLLASKSGRGALRRIATALRKGHLRTEDVVRNPSGGDDLPARIERVVARAEASSRRTRAREAAGGLRLHPRIVVAIERELTERAERVPGDEALSKTVDGLQRARGSADAVTREFVHSNLRIVVTFARRYRGMPLIDLIQEGNLGLLRAVDKFDHRRGLRFSTYAAWWIRHALGRALADQSKMIRLPVHLVGTLGRLRRTQEKFRRDHGRLPTNEELSSLTGVPAQQVSRALDVVAQPVSLDMRVRNEHDAPELVDFVVDNEARAADETVAERELRDDTAELLELLDEREATVIRLRFGIGGVRQRTLEEIGAALSVSRERARQLERDALKKLRAASEERQLDAHLRA